MTDSILRCSWLVDRLAEAELAAARAVLASALGEAGLPAPLRAAVGPPLRHPLDPRRDYMAEEAAFARRLGGWQAGGRETADSVREDDLRFPFAGDLARAAAPPPPYGRAPVLLVAEQHLTLRLTAADVRAHLRVQVCDSDGSLSRALDGYVICGRDGSDSRPLRAGECIIRTPAAGAGMVLLGPGGERLDVRVSAAGSLP